MQNEKKGNEKNVANAISTISSKASRLFVALFEIFDQILALANKLMFVPKLDSQKSVVLVIGEMGNGKSTTLNNLINMLNE